MRLERIINEAKTKECWSVSGKFNYGPIKSFELGIFFNGFSKYKMDVYYKNLRKVTDAKTYFAYEFLRFDIYVNCGHLFYLMGRAFPEIEKETIFEWISELKGKDQVLLG